jgi:hypothetical protein
VRRERSGRTGDVTFRNVAIPVRAYELRTGNLVFAADHPLMLI